MAVAGLPWKEILTGATLVAGVARDLMKKQSRSRQVAGADADPKSQVAQLAQRMEALEISGEEQARLMKMLADEVQVLARRAMVGYWIGVAGLVVALASLAAWLLR